MNTPDSFTPRGYPDVVRDLLTSLTGGTVREAVIIPAGDVIVLDTLAKRPLHRVSHLQGVVAVQRPRRDANGDLILDAAGNAETETAELPYRFTDADFELIATGSAGAQLDAIRFRQNGRKPPIGSTATVNYYPTRTTGVPITDLNVGSVARTMMESVARELALEELLLENVYRSAFLDTAEGANLDKVVALVGVRRRPGGVATANIRFTRAAGSTGRITVPAATTVSDTDGHRYATVTPLVLEPGEPSREVLAAAIALSTPAVAAGTLTQLEVLIAGVSAVTNDTPAAAASAPETDDQLRERARSALAVAARGTVDALRYGLLAVDGVKDVVVVEFPNGVPGEIRVDVAYKRDDDTAAQRQVEARIEELRPAGVRVLSNTASTTPVTVTAAITLAGDGVDPAALPALQTDLETRVTEHIRALPPGGTLRQAQAVMAALADPRILDAAFEFSAGGPPSAGLTATAGAVLSPIRPFTVTLSTETGSAGPAVSIRLDAQLPLHLVAGVSAADAQQALQLAAASYAGGLRGGDAITVDGLCAALADNTRYVIVRSQVAATTLAGDRFRQLADGLGEHPLGPNDTVTLGTIAVDVRDGGV